MSKLRFYIICCFVCILILGFQPLTSVQAAVPINDPFWAVFDIDLSIGATYPALAYNPQNQEYLLVWCRQQAGSAAIYAMQISKTGVFGAVYPVSETTGTTQRCKPDVAYNTTNHNYLIVWEDIITGPQFYVHGRLFTPGGTLGDEVTFNESGSSNYVFPAVAYSSTSNEFLVVWAAQPYGGNYSILAQRLSNTGVKLGGNYTVDQGHDTTNNYDPDVAYNPSRNEYLIVWTRQSPDPIDLNRDIFGQILTYDLIPLGGQLEIGYFTIEESVPAVAAIQTPAPESGRYLVTWEVLYDNGDHDIWERIIKGNGSMLEVIGVSASYLDERAPSVAGNMHSNTFLVLWNSTSPAPFQSNIQVRSCNVTLQGKVFDRAWVGGIKSEMSAVAPDQGDNFLAVFEDTSIFPNGAIIGNSCLTGCFYR